MQPQAHSHEACLAVFGYRKSFALDQIDALIVRLEIEANRLAAQPRHDNDAVRAVIDGISARAS